MPVAGRDELRTYSQHSVDVINTRDNVLQTSSFHNLMKEKLDIPLEYLATEDEEITQKLRDLGRNDEKSWIITFDELLSNTAFSGHMHSMLKTLEKQYNYPVDIEFTVNFTRDGGFLINLVQCRPLQTIGEEKPVDFPSDIAEDNILFSMDGNFMGGSISQPIKRLIYVEPLTYNDLPLQQKYSVARVIGELNRQIVSREDLPTMLLGPGRWGTTTPSLGVPVHFSEINNIMVLGEIASIEGNFMPELSFGTHFFQDLVENRIFFVAIFPWKEGVFLNTSWLHKLPSMLGELIPEEEGFRDVIKVYDVHDKKLRIVADVVKQKVLSYSDNG